MMPFNKFKEHVRRRNLEILERSRRGEKHYRIAEHFNLSRSRIDFIIQEFAEEEQWQKRCAVLFDSIRQADDLNRIWPVEDLVEMIALLPMTRSYLKKHFLEQRVTELRLNNLMEMIIPDSLDASDPSRRSMPLLKVYGVGRKGFWSLVNRLTNLDLGGQFNEEWKRRLVILRREWKITGEFPYT